MTREQAKDMLPIIQAFAEGRTIQIKALDGLWHSGEDGKCEINFNADPQKYRIKSEPKYRPFKDVEECWQEMQKHQPVGWIKTDEGYEQMWHVNKCDDFNTILKICTFADGTPFGIKEE